MSDPATADGEMRQFAALKFAWIDRLAMDARIGHFAFRVAVVMSRYFSSDGRPAYPSQMTIADALGATRRGVQKAIDGLTQAGHLEVIDRGGRLTNLYRPVIPDANDGSLQEPADANGGSPLAGPDANDGSLQNGFDANGHSSQGRTVVHPINVKEQSKEDKKPPISPVRSKGGSAKNDPDFDRFWRQYPRKVSRGQAERAWSAARRRTSAEEIIAGCLRYSAERVGQEAQFTKHAATWLNGQCWMDEPSPKASSELGTHGIYELVRDNPPPGYGPARSSHPSRAILDLDPEDRR